jgi:3-(3-hydroxy-phenyl)propionate hydroxylase
VLCWNNDPRRVLGDVAFSTWKSLGARFVAVRPNTQLHWTGQDDADVVVVGDRDGRLKSWFDTRDESVLFLRPDRCIAGACVAQLAPDTSAALVSALSLTPGGTDAARPLLHVAQPAAGSG